MKVLVISTSYPVSQDGSEAAGSFVQDFVESLKEQGQEVAVIAPVVGGAPYTYRHDITHYWFTVPKLPLSLLSPKNPRDWLPVLTTLKQGKRVVDQAISEFKPDHIFALWALPSGYWARYAKRRYGVPYSIWALGSDIWSLGKVPVIRSYLKTVLKDANYCFADGYELANDVTAISARPCDFLPSTRQLPVCGIPIDRAKSPYRLCFLGRWHPNKGIDLLLNALDLLDKSEWKNIEEVRIAGGGAMEAEVKAQVVQLQGKGYPVMLSGFLDKQGAAELLTWTDYIIIPSRIESIPVIFSDAMQVMRPVIAMPVGDLPELLNKYQCGWLVNKVSAESLCQTIKQVIHVKTDDESSFDACDKGHGKGITLAKKAFELPSISQQFIRTIMGKG